MKAFKRIAALCRLVSCAALVLGTTSAWPDPTSLEVTGLLFDGSGNRITAQPYMIYTEAIYDSATGGTLLADLGTEHVQVNNGFYLQVFGLDDSLFSGTAYLQVNLNGFDMGPRLGIFFNGTYFFANGMTAGGPGPAGTNLFEMYAGMATPPAIPEPEIAMLFLAGAATVGMFARRKRGREIARRNSQH